MIELNQQTAFITGAARRLGRATALALADAGVNVIVHYRSSAGEAATLASEIKDRGVGAWTVKADLGDIGQASTLFGRAAELAGPIDILINNASFFTESNVTDFPMDEMTANMNVHAAAPLLFSRALAAQGRSGSIVNFLDTRVTDYDRKHAAYHLSKRMLFTLTRMLANELAPDIRVNAVAPGLVLPPEGKDESYLSSIAHSNPLNRYGTEQDVVDAVLFLLRSDFVTGQVIYIDGGRHMAGSMYG